MSPTFRALRVRNYRLYALGGVVSNTGTWMQRVAQDWLVLQLHHGSSAEATTALGLTTGLQFLPILLLSPYAGLVADRMPKRRLLQLTQAWMGLTSLVLAGARPDRGGRDLDGLRDRVRLRDRAPPSTPRPGSRSSARWSAPPT